LTRFDFSADHARPPRQPKEVPEVQNRDAARLPQTTRKEVTEMVHSFMQDERGQGMVEYGLIIGLIAIIVIAVFVALGPQIKEMFENAVSEKQMNDGVAAISGKLYEGVQTN